MSHLYATFLMDMTITHDDPAVNEVVVDSMELSDALLNANRRLHELRAKQAPRSVEKEQNAVVVLRPEREAECCRVEQDVLRPSSSDNASYPQPIQNKNNDNDEPRDMSVVEAVNRRLHAERAAYIEAQQSPLRQQGGCFTAPVEEKEEKIGTDTVLLHPGIAVELLKTEKVSVGRIWLLARSLDPTGSGRISIGTLRKKFTRKRSKYRVCGWRRLRMLLEEGEGTFWERDEEGRLWIYGSGRVANNLGLEIVEGVSVHLEVKTLLNIQSCRAQLYASWFSGRKTTNPISRVTLSEITGVTEEQQRLYEQIAKVDVKQCLAIGPLYSLEGMQEAHYQRGGVLGHGAGVAFEFVDHKGKQGRAGEKYIAWHLPNQYTGRHKRAGKSSRRNINRYLKRKSNLEEKLALGNVYPADTEDKLVVPVFFPHLKAASTRQKKVRVAKEIYWPGKKTSSTQFWYAVPQNGGNMV